MALSFQTTCGGSQSSSGIWHRHMETLLQPVFRLEPRSSSTGCQAPARGAKAVSPRCRRSSAGLTTAEARPLVCHHVWPSLSQSLSGLFFWLNIATVSRFEHLCKSTGTFTSSRSRSHTGVIEAFIQMAVSLGSGLTQELLLLVREDWMDSRSSPLSLSLCSSATIPPLPPPLVPLKQHPHFSSVPNSLTPPPPPPPSFLHL